MCFTGAVCYIKNDRRQNYRKKHQQRYKRTRARAYKRLVTTPLVLGHQRGGTITFTKPKNAQNNKEPEEKQTEATATVIQTKRQKREEARVPSSPRSALFLRLGLLSDQVADDHLRVGVESGEFSLRCANLITFESVYDRHAQDGACGRREMLDLCRSRARCRIRERFVKLFTEVL